MSVGKWDAQAWHCCPAAFFRDENFQPAQFKCRVKLQTRTWSFTGGEDVRKVFFGSENSSLGDFSSLSLARAVEGKSLSERGTSACTSFCAWMLLDTRTELKYLSWLLNQGDIARVSGFVSLTRLLENSNSKDFYDNSSQLAVVVSWFPLILSLIAINVEFILRAVAFMSCHYINKCETSSQHVQIVLFSWKFIWS